jgi:hypothetical protein
MTSGFRDELDLTIAVNSDGRSPYLYSASAAWRTPFRERQKIYSLSVPVPAGWIRCSTSCFRFLCESGCFVPSVILVRTLNPQKCLDVDQVARSHSAQIASHRPGELQQIRICVPIRTGLILERKSILLRRPPDHGIEKDVAHRRREKGEHGDLAASDVRTASRTAIFSHE